MWVNPIIFNWDAMVESSSDYTSDVWKRSHELWSHTQRILGSPRMSLVDKFFEAEVPGSSEALKKLYQLYFEIV